MALRWLIYVVASGQTYFGGGIAIAIAVGGSARVRGTWTRMARNLLAAVGTIAVVASATPLALVPSVVLAAVTLLWIAAEAVSRRLPHRVVPALRAIAILAWSAAMLAELPYHLPPRLPPVGPGPIAIIGDSVTAGIDGPGAVTWPKLLADREGRVVHDHSRMGATTASALRQAAAISPGDRLVLVEIGGNDLLGDTSPERFEADLDALLLAVARPGRVVVMFELPLPPFANQFGLAQRRLARKHRVVLIPKRMLLAVLQGGGATLDSIHLSPSGHRAMAEAVAGLFRPDPQP